MQNITLPRSVWAAIRRGGALKCPQCGAEKLFTAYLKPVSQCGTCGKDWRNVRADLAPAWAAMTFSAHIIIPVYFSILFDKPIPNWAATSILIGIASIICLVTLPVFKGAFMAIVWWNRMEKEQQG